jgi:hypothetical protein
MTAMMPARFAALTIAVIVTLAPIAAQACPVCGASDRPGLGLLALVGGMIAVPYVVAVVAFKVIRRADHETADLRTMPSDDRAAGRRPPP